MLREAARRSTLQAFNQDQRRPVWFCPPQNVSYDQDQTKTYRPSPRNRCPMMGNIGSRFRMCTIGWRMSRPRESAKRPQKSFGGAGPLTYPSGLAVRRSSPGLVTARFTELVATKVLHIVPASAGHGADVAGGAAATAAGFSGTGASAFGADRVAR